MPDSTSSLEIGALLALPDAQFLPQVFSTLLGREPDATGLKHYAKRLQHGASRMLVLAEIRHSAEGQAYAKVAKSTELDALVDRYRLVRNWPIGRWRWALLPRYVSAQPRERFDWERWATNFAANGQKPVLSTSVQGPSGGPEIEHELATLQQQIVILADALEHATVTMQAQGVPAHALAPMQQAAAHLRRPALPTSAISWEARSIYSQLLECMQTAE